MFGCNIHDNILNVNVFIPSMILSKGKYPMVLLKIDLEKAFDDIHCKMMNMLTCLICLSDCYSQIFSYMRGIPYPWTTGSMYAMG